MFLNELLFSLKLFCGSNQKWIQILKVKVMCRSGHFKKWEVFNCIFFCWLSLAKRAHVLAEYNKIWFKHRG